MIGNNPMTQAATIVAATKAVGATLPEDAAEAYEATAEALKSLQTIYPKAGMAPVVAAALLAGRDPATDPEVQRTHLAMQLADHGTTTLTENILIEKMRQNFYPDDIVSVWVKPFAAAAAVLAHAHDRLGAIDLADTTSVVQLGGDAAEVWAKAQTAVSTIATITNAWAALVEFTRSANINVRYPALRIAAVDAATWRSLELERKRIGPWEATVAGLTLALPTVTEYRQRIADIERGMAEQVMAEQPTDRSREGVRDWAGKVGTARRVGMVNATELMSR